MLQDLFSAKIQELEREVKYKLSDAQLFDENCVARLISKYSLNVPKLSKEDMEVEIKSEVLTQEKAPPGFSFVLGESYDYAIYSIPFSVNSEILRHLFKMGRRDYGLFFENGSVHYKEFSQSNLAANADERNAIKEKAKKEIASLENTLEIHSKQVEEFNTIVLATSAKNSVTEERDKRNRHKSAEDSLKF